MISIQHFGIQAAAAAVAIVFNQTPPPGQQENLWPKTKNVVVSCRSRVSIDPFTQPNVV
jgi:hypothetical protein